MDNLIEQKNWFLKKYVFFLQMMLKSLIKEIRIKNNDIEIKTTSNNLRALLYVLQKHLSLRNRFALTRFLGLKCFYN